MSITKSYDVTCSGTIPAEVFFNLLLLVFSSNAIESGTTRKKGTILSQRHVRAAFIPILKALVSLLSVLAPITEFLNCGS